MSFVDKYPTAWGIKTIALIFVMSAIDFGYHFATSVHIDEETREEISEKKEEIVEFYNRLVRR
jgi:hypothetical protein